MARGDVPTTPPITRTVDYGAKVREMWGDAYLIPEVAYRFSNGRTFNDSGISGGPYTGTSTS